MTPSRRRATRAARFTLRGAMLLGFAFALVAAPATAPAATRLFISNHVASNDVRALTPWGGDLALATGGGLVFADTTTGATTKVLRSVGGLASNNLMAIAVSPAGYLWIGTADAGLSRMRPDGSFLRALTSFDGLPSDRVQAIYRTGDSLWIATGGGVALFTENAAGRVTLRRSDSSASTGGGLLSDDVACFAAWNDTLWCGTNGGLSAFASGTWIARASVAAVRVQALLVASDTLWIGTAAGLRAYAGGVAQPRGTTVETLALAALPWGVGRGTTAGLFVYDASGAESAPGIGGLPSSRVQALLTTPTSRVVAATIAGLGRFSGGATPWTAIRSAGPEMNGGARVSAASGNVWVALGNSAPPGLSIGTILRYTNGAWSYLTSGTTGGNLQSAGALGLLGSSDGRLWIGHCCSNVSGSGRPRTDRWDPATDTWDLPAAYNIIRFTQAPSGSVYGVGVEHENGVYAFDGATAALLDSLTPGNTGGGGLTRNNLRGISFDDLGRAWIATVDNGVDRWDGKGTPDHADDTWAHFTAGFPNLQTTSILAVTATDVWVGTQGGGVRIRDERPDVPASFALNAAIQSAAVNDLVLDSDGAVWVATATGLARVAPSGTVERFTANDGLASSNVQGLAWDGARRTLWALTAGGVSEIHPGLSGKPSFGEGSYLYPNPVTPASPIVRLGGINGAIRGEVRDLAGNTLREFRADPAAPAIWDLRDARGETVAPGVYLVVLRQGDLKRVLRVAVTR